ncbi:MAG: signal peptidase I [Candidatus Liptonbacteria bacterium RIFCSPLOWO2_12_FULL_60_15]|uniref:Signal peptidase I n=3 Tax=Candidatus Liptoniibacteriota TaxID=1817909 RepID=A0A1G2CNT1_9BACT|nr:MAG: signal peptidase I [Candidatus Liptonbacteria bacterium RIFCSPHIGHO2_12_FULL_60_13]OGZ02872.1 MAG: signal peptidase I [Candidatus Liptonbacteria bacterium RIFCSPLOWO2_12_FULL_60_15]
MKRLFVSSLEVLEVAFVAVAAVFVVRTFLVQPFLVSGASMEPSFSHGDYLLVDELSYYFRKPERGEVVVFKYPGDESVYYIKRIIGLPGEEVRVREGAVRVVNAEHPEGVKLAESYLPQDLKTPRTADITLGEDQYFVMGDNRLQSFDSRDWGPVKRGEVIGIARLRLWPLAKVMAFERPAY